MDSIDNFVATYSSIYLAASVVGIAAAPVISNYLDSLDGRIGKTQKTDLPSRIGELGYRISRLF